MFKLWPYLQSFVIILLHCSIASATLLEEMKGAMMGQSSRPASFNLGVVDREWVLCMHHQISLPLYES